MEKEIAVFLGENGQTISLYEAGLVKVYVKEMGEWKSIREVPFTIDKTEGIKSVRRSFAAMMQELDKCRIFVGKEVVGLPYTILEIGGFNIWELEGCPEDFLDYVLEKEMQEEEIEDLDREGAKVMDTPQSPNEDGNYYINLNELQRSKLGITSKKALLPFLRNTAFNQLEIICSHVPLWLNGELERLSLKSFSKKVGISEYKVTVYPITSNSNMKPELIFQS